MTQRKKLIEVALPLEAINQASATTSLRAKRSNLHAASEEIASPPAAARNDTTGETL